MPPKYDFAAADRLGQQLSQLIAKIDWYIWLRAGQRTSLLGAPHSDNWQGGKRTHFETDFARQQAALHALKDMAGRLQANVATATATAHAAQKAAEKNGQ